MQLHGNLDSASPTKEDLKGQIRKPKSNFTSIRSSQGYTGTLPIPTISPSPLLLGIPIGTEASRLATGPNSIQRTLIFFLINKWKRSESETFDFIVFTAFRHRKWQLLALKDESGRAVFTATAAKNVCLHHFQLGGSGLLLKLEHDRKEVKKPRKFELTNRKA